ncbi:hypothetical protein HP456_08445 [Bacillus haikouensis]|uniref:hypothetical protein n=1 Tax=Bacillus haikouensis TaxID=1510468 RepID=UPI00155748E9|nr:hypothetical protein [Bacillus haikouensis]NQD65952.1 hypothetical protein [Bacillus haikouensis]
MFELEDLMKLTEKPRHSFTAISLADSKQIILLHLPVWESFTEREHHHFLVNHGALWVHDAALWDKVAKDSQNEMKKNYPHLMRRVDMFPFSNGPNCLAAVAAAITRNEAFINTWMKEEEFLGVLKEENYVPCGSESLTEGDVLMV